MKNQSTFTKILAITGTLLIWFPILAPILLSATYAMQERKLRFDYLMPAELFPFALLGGIMLLWAALRVHAWRRMIGWGLVVALVMLAGGQAIAVATGLANGQIGMDSGWFALVLAMLIVYLLAMVVIGVGGALLLADLFRRHGQATGMRG
jgi:hypothetical protein